MRDVNSPYPLRVISRNLPATRTSKLRVSWFVLGVAFGIGCTSALGPILTPGAATVASFTPADVQKPTVSATSTLPEPAAIKAPDATAAAADKDVPAAEVALDVDPAKEAALPASTADTYPLDLTLKVANGDTLLNILTSSGVSSGESYDVLEAIKKVYDPKKLDIGQNIAVHLDRDPKNPGKPTIQSMVLPISQTSSLEVTKAGENFVAKKLDAPTERKVTHAGGPIKSSLYETGADNGIPASLLAELITAYSYDVDFQRDIQAGDAVDVLYERMETKDGAVASYGKIIFAELDLGDRKLKIYRFTDSQGNADYYNSKGESVRKALLRTPVNGAKITSKFGMRSHPLLGYTKMHRGVDFGAPTGTPIYAAGDGTVEFVGQKSGYGNYMRIKHNGTYSTAYAHISRFATGMSNGRKVKQGQIIAYVGSTGMATGPHLHYEVLASNTQVNPANIKFKTGTTLAGKELVAFRKNIEQVEAKMASVPRGGKADIAMNDTAPKSSNKN